MGWSLGWSSEWQRDIGYGVVAFCDHPKCNEKIDRGLGYSCGGHHGEKGCGLYFCGKHLFGAPQRCPKCARYDHKPYKAKQDHPEWMAHKLLHESWQEWRDENPKEVAKLKAALTPEDIAAYQAIAKLDYS